MESRSSPQSLDAKARPRHIRFEANRVGELLRRFDLKDLENDLYDDYGLNYGVRRLSFESFRYVVPTFPYVMDAQPFYATTAGSNRWSTISSWLTRFPSTFVGERFSALLDLYEGQPNGLDMGASVQHVQRGRPLAMCFRWSWVRGGLVAHNGKPLTDSAFSTVLPRRDGNVRVHVESYREWLKSFAQTGWTPNTPATLPELDENASVVRPQLSSGILRACGQNPRDAWLLSWLIKATGERALAWERELFVRVNGILYVAATHTHMASITGLSEQQVRDAVKSLLARGFVRRPPKGWSGTGRKTVLFVDREECRHAIAATAQ